jgi:hypothetical protein
MYNPNILAEHYEEENHFIPVMGINPSSLVVHQLSNPGSLLSHKDILTIEETSTYIENWAIVFL